MSVPGMLLLPCYLPLQEQHLLPPFPAQTPFLALPSQETLQVLRLASAAALQLQLI